MQKRWEGSDWKPKDNKQDWGESFHFFQTIRKRSFCSRQRRVEIRLNGFCLHGKDKNKEKRGQELPIFKKKNTTSTFGYIGKAMSKKFYNISLLNK